MLENTMLEVRDMMENYSSKVMHSYNTSMDLQLIE